MVRAILDGRKTVTRRVVKKQQCLLLGKCEPSEISKSEFLPYNSMSMEEYLSATYKSQYRAGDTLYVRETWEFLPCIECMNQLEDETCMEGKTSTIYKDKDAESEGCFIYRADHPHPERVNWRPSIHMPKEAARIWLKVKGVRVERINAMTLNDFFREGVVIMPEEFNDPDNAYRQAKDDFIDIWDSTVRKPELKRYGWDANPWVWVIEFERCEKPEPCILSGVEPAEDKRPCIGYGKSEDDDEPCEMCKGCRSRNG